MKLPIIVLGFAIASGSLHAESPGPSVAPDALRAAHATTSAISAERIKEDVRVLSLDEFLGPGPGEGGDEKAIKYIADSLAATGLEAAGENGFWDVPLVRLDRQTGAKLSLKIGGKSVPLELGRNDTLALRNPGSTTIEEATLVFAGSGIVVPAKPRRATLTWLADLASGLKRWGDKWSGVSNIPPTLCSQGGEIDRRARLRIAKSSVSLHCFAFHVRSGLRGEIAVFLEI